MTEPNTPEHAGEDHEARAGDPVDDGFTNSTPVAGGEHGPGFTPRPGEHVDGGWKPDEFPHGEPDPGPSLAEDPGARGPEARSSLPRSHGPVPPEAGEAPQPERAGEPERES